MRREVKEQNQIRDLRSKKLRVKALDQKIPGLEEALRRAIAERAGLEAAIIKVEAHDLAKNHNGLCNRTPLDTGAYKGHSPCERFYGHTGKHSWEGGGVG